jgi:hypothetical protein
METNLPELCRRVWGKVPEAAPDKDTHLMIQASILYPEKVEIDMIQAAALRWLLANSCIVADNGGTGYVTYPRKVVGPYWEVRNPDLTTCLLLAVERCHEYKESKE